MCNAKDTWHALSVENRKEFLRPIGSLIDKVEAGRTKVIAWGFNDESTPERADYDFFAAFVFPNAAAAGEYHRIFTAAGWYRYFEQVNIAGDVQHHSEVTERLVGL